MREMLVVAAIWGSVVAPVGAQQPARPPPTPIRPFVATPWDTAVLDSDRDDDPMAIIGVTVIDVERGERSPDQTVVIRENRITGVGPSASLSVPADARTIDGRSAYLIPGLFDAHVHLTEEKGPLPPLYLAFGITSVRDMGGYLDSLKVLRSRIGAGAEPGPRIYFAGRPIDGDPPQWPALYPDVPVIVRTRSEARAAVREARAAGVDFIKLYHGLSPLLLREAAAEAHAQGLRAAADLLPWGFSPESALGVGLDGLEHGIPSSPGVMGWWADRAAMERIVAKLADEGTTLTSTLVGIDRVRPRLPTAEPTYQALPPALRERSAEMVRLSNPPAQIFEYECLTVHELVAKGGELLAGTDSYYMAAFPGDLHRELELLVECGLTTAQALAAGSVNPARWLGADSLGVVAEGKLADLLLLDADPLADVRNTRQIRAVIANGRLFDREALEALLADPETAAGTGSRRR